MERKITGHGSSGFVPGPPARLGCGNRTQAIFRESIKREAQAELLYQQRNSEKQVPRTRELAWQAPQPIENPYTRATAISSPRLAGNTEIESVSPPPATLKLVRRVEVPWVREIKVPVKRPTKQVVYVDRKVRTTKMIPDGHGGQREVHGFSVVKLPEEREVMEDAFEIRRVEETKLLEVEELQQFEWEPKAVGPATVLASRHVGFSPRHQKPNAAAVSRAINASKRAPSRSASRKGLYNGPSTMYVSGSNRAFTPQRAVASGSPANAPRRVQSRPSSAYQQRRASSRQAQPKQRYKTKKKSGARSKYTASPSYMNATKSSRSRSATPVVSQEAMDGLYGMGRQSLTPGFLYRRDTGGMTPPRGRQPYRSTTPYQPPQRYAQQAQQRTIW